jgi:hypothetical protein
VNFETKQISGHKRVFVFDMSSPTLAVMALVIVQPRITFLSAVVTVLHFYVVSTHHSFFSSILVHGLRTPL